MSDPGTPAEMPDFGAILSQLGQMKQNLYEAQEAATARVIEGSAGGGAVKVVGTGGLEVSSVHIDPSVLDDVDMLQDLVLTAVRDLISAAQALQAETLGGLGLGGGDVEGLLGG